VILALSGWLACSLPAGPPPAEQVAVRAVADAAGGTWVRCSLEGVGEVPGGPVAVSEGWAARGDAEVWLAVPADRQVTTLSPQPPEPPAADADDEAMRAYLAARRDAGTPWGVARWAGQGEGRDCTVSAPEPITVTGRVVGGEGDGVVRGCGGVFPVSGHRFEVTTTDGEPCELRHDKAPASLAVQLTRDPAPARVEVPADPGAERAMDRVGDQLRQAADQVARAKAAVDRLEAAEASVDGDAEDLVGQWLARATAERERATAAYDNLSRFRTALEHAQQTYGQKPPTR